MALSPQRQAQVIESLRSLQVLELSRRLAGANTPFAAFQALTVCEFVVAADQQEWLRLMLEAEWYG